MGQKMRFATRAIHGGQDPDPAFGAVMPPIYQTSTFAQDAPGVHRGYTYSRSANPTRSAMERAVAELEEARYGLAFASGLAAIDAVLSLLRPGDELLSINDPYGGSYRLFKKVFEPYGVGVRLVSMDAPRNLAAHISARTRLVWIESPTNPLLNIVDIAAIAAQCRKHRILLAVDNTFATPYLQRPLTLGADIVMHSATKYLGGHSDVVAGVLAVNDKDLADRLYFVQNARGAVCGPMDAYLLLRGLKTLHVRMDRHCSNARQIASFLRERMDVAKVYWPGFGDHPNHEVARTQMADFGGMVSFAVKGGADRVNEVLKGLRLFTLAESLGGVESLVGYPAQMSHAGMPREERERVGITDCLIRLSIGIEDADDLQDDLRLALDK